MSRLGARWWAALVACAASSPGCRGIQSTLDPASEQAARLATLFWGMAAGAAVIWTAVVVLAVYYGRPHDGTPNRARDRWLIIGSGVVLPVVVLTALLAYGLSLLPSIVARAPEGSLLVEVHGEQWWWRVRYVAPDGATTELANEIRLPVGEPVQFKLSSDNVIHSFWIPALGGKMDMIPGRTTYLALHPTRTGIFAGTCAEYCGSSHAFMRFMVQVMERDAFNDWLSQQSRPAAPPRDAQARRGEEVLLTSGCGACHTVRGTMADGVIAPDLTHVGSRLSLAAGALANDVTAFERWLAAPERTKPGVHMPAFGMLGDDDLRALAAYLEGLQ